jgi:hypothetical protein
MAQVLGIGDRAIRKWVSGEAEVPIGVWHTILHLIRQRQGALGEAAAEIEGLIAHQENAQ